MKLQNATMSNRAVSSRDFGSPSHRADQAVAWDGGALRGLWESQPSQPSREGITPIGIPRMGTRGYAIVARLRQRSTRPRPEVDFFQTLELQSQAANLVQQRQPLHRRGAMPCVRKARE